MVPLGRAAEEVDHAAFAHHGDGRLPGGRGGDGLDDDVGAAAVAGQRAHGCRPCRTSSA